MDNYLPHFDTTCENCRRRYPGEDSPDSCPHCDHPQRYEDHLDVQEKKSQTPNNYAKGDWVGRIFLGHD